MNTTQKKPYELKQASPHYQENVCINRPAHSQEEDNELLQAGACGQAVKALLSCSAATSLSRPLPFPPLRHADTHSS